MMKSSLYLFLSLALISCGKSGGGGGSNQSEVDSSNISTSTPVPNAALTFDANVKMIGFSRNQEEKVLDAVDLIKQVVATDEFKDRILNHKYNGRKTFVNNNGLSNAQIYAKILEGAEKLNPKKNNTLDVTLELYYVNANVIGYTLPTVNKIWMNTKYLNKFTPVDVTDNLFHEWLHKVGFGHAYKATPSRKYSVPYAVGYIMKDLARKYY